MLKSRRDGGGGGCVEPMTILGVLRMAGRWGLVAGGKQAGVEGCGVLKGAKPEHQVPKRLDRVDVGYRWMWMSLCHPPAEAAMVTEP